LKITSVQIKHFEKNGFYSVCNEGRRHIKVLPYLSIVQSVEGSYDISLGSGAPLCTGDGGFFIAPSNVQQTIVHHVNKSTKRMTCRWIFLDVEINKSFSLDSLYQFPAVINESFKNELNLWFDRIFETDDIWQNYSDCYALIGDLLKKATPMPSQINNGVRSAVAYINEHYPKKITIKTLSNIANLSESNFYVVFKKQMGISPIAYLNHYRLSVSTNKLVDTADTVSEISYSVGINDPLYFSKLFKKTYGMTPKEYRLLYQRKY